MRLRVGGALEDAADRRVLVARLILGIEDSSRVTTAAPWPYFLTPNSNAFVSPALHATFPFFCCVAAALESFLLLGEEGRKNQRTKAI